MSLASSLFTNARQSCTRPSIGRFAGSCRSFHHDSRRATLVSLRRHDSRSPTHAVRALLVTRSFSLNPFSGSSPARPPVDTPPPQTAFEKDALSASTPSLETATTAPLDSPPPPLTENVTPSFTSETLSPDFYDTVMSTIPAPLQYGDLAALGLAGWTPAGFARWTMELINVSTGMPWFWTLIAGTVLLRLTVLPFTIKSMQTSSRLPYIQPDMKKIQAAIEGAKARNDQAALRQGATDMAKLFEKSGFKATHAFLGPLTQLPVALGLFFGVRQLCSLPVVQLTYSGFSMLPDLTIPDPMMILPIAAIALFQTQILISSRDMDLVTRPEAGHFLNLMRVLTMASFFVIKSFPVGLLVSMMTGGMFSIIQSLAFRNLAFRRWCNIAPVPPAQAAQRLPTIWESFKRGRLFLDTLTQESKQTARILQVEDSKRKAKVAAQKNLKRK